jgi:CRISPR-associated endonuclease Cas2
VDRLVPARFQGSVRALLAYDIVDDDRRVRAAEAALDFILRTQLSVYDGWVPANQLLPLWGAVRHVLKPTEDAALLVAFCQACACHAGGIGAAAAPDTPDTGWII